MTSGRLVGSRFLKGLMTDCRFCGGVKVFESIHECKVDNAEPQVYETALLQ